MELFSILNPIQWGAGVLFLLLATYVSSYREEKLAKYLMFFFFESAVWCLAAAATFLVDDLATKILLNRVKMAAVFFIPVTVFFLSLQVHGDFHISKRVRYALLTVPFIFFLANLTPLHEQIIGNYSIVVIEGLKALSFENGVIFTIHNIATRGFLLASFYVLFRIVWGNKSPQRKVAWMFIIALIVPSILDSLAVYFFPVLRYLQIVPVTFSFTGFIFCYALFKQSALKMVPYARSQVVTNLKDPCLMWNSLGNLIDYNNAAKEVFHIGKELDLARNEINQKLNAIKDGRIKLGEKTYKVINEPVSDNSSRELGSYTMLIDITTQIHHEEELKKIVNVKNKVFGILSHDLGEHIGNITLSADILNNDFEELDKEQQQTLIGYIYDLTQDFSVFMQDLLQWSKTQSVDWKLQEQEINLHKLCIKLVGLLAPLAKIKGQTISCNVDKEFTYNSDPYMLEIIIRNLLYNAVKHSRALDHIEITLKDQSLVISNPGEMKNIDLYNDQFDLSKNLKNSFGSFGLGLHLCKEFSRVIKLPISFRHSTNLVITEINLK